MYGSKKQDDPIPWRVQYTINIQGDKLNLTHHETKDTGKDPNYIKLFSIRNKQPTVAPKVLAGPQPCSRQSRQKLMGDKAIKAIKQIKTIKAIKKFRGIQKVDGV
jgi:hypothetical protein